MNKQEVADQIRNFIEYYTSNEEEGIRMFNALEDYMKEVYNG
jgi:pilus assembly protein TadC